MVGLSMISSISPICGGALISDQYVLTAAHCCKGKDAERLQVFLGDHDWAISEESDSFRRAVEKITIHPNYGKPQQLNNDVCLLKLSTPISFPDHPLVRPVCLPPNSQTKYGNAEAIVTGWGKVSGDGKLSQYLQETEVVIMTQGDCKNIFGGLITSKMMCIAKDRQPLATTCNGDSGGSVLHRNGESFDSVGIVSWGVTGCVERKPSVAARVTSALSWIQRNTMDSNFCPRLN